MGVVVLKFKNVGSLSIREVMWCSMREVRSVFWLDSSFDIEDPRLLMGFYDALLFAGLPLTNSHNARSAKLRFYIPHAGVLQ